MVLLVYAGFCVFIHELGIWKEDQQQASPRVPMIDTPSCLPPSLSSDAFPPKEDTPRPSVFYHPVEPLTEALKYNQKRLQQWHTKKTGYRRVSSHRQLPQQKFWYCSCPGKLVHWINQIQGLITHCPLKLPAAAADRVDEATGQLTDAASFLTGASSAAGVGAGKREWLMSSRNVS